MASEAKSRRLVASDRNRGSLTPDSWISAATDVLADHGIDSVRLDVLARTLNVTRGSFYWHFRDREDLLRRVLQAWRQRTTEQLTARLESASTDPVTQLRDLISLPFRGRSAIRVARIELAIRAWARRDELARAFMDEADASRMGYIAQVFSSLGFSIGEARSHSFLLYSYVVAESLFSTPASAAQRQQRTAILEQPVIEKILTHLGLQARAPPRSPARGPLLQAA